MLDILALPIYGKMYNCTVHEIWSILTVRVHSSIWKQKMLVVDTEDILGRENSPVSLDSKKGRTAVREKGIHRTARYICEGACFCKHQEYIFCWKSYLHRKFFDLAGIFLISELWIGYLGVPQADFLKGNDEVVCHFLMRLYMLFLYRKSRRKCLDGKSRRKFFELEKQNYYQDLPVVSHSASGYFSKTASEAFQAENPLSLPLVLDLFIGMKQGEFSLEHLRQPCKNYWL